VRACVGLSIFEFPPVSAQQQQNRAGETVPVRQKQQLVCLIPEREHGREQDGAKVYARLK